MRRAHSYDVDEAEKDNYNSGRYNYPPECETKRFLACCFLVEVSENGHA